MTPLRCCWITLALALAGLLPQCALAEEFWADQAPEECVRCCPPRTLLQWAHGVEDEGGPPGPDEPLASDRPDFTEASTTVGRGVTQLEMGYTYIRGSSGADQVDAHSFPETLLRVGAFAEWLEFRIAYNYATEDGIFGGTAFSTRGSEGLYLGIKLGLTPQFGVLPEMALMPQMTVPLGTDYSADEVLPGLSWLSGWDITERVGVGGSTQFNKAVDEDGTIYYELAQSVTMAFSLTERWGAYTEWFAFFPSGAPIATNEHYLNGGFTFLVSNDLQLDVRAGFGLNEGADDFFSGVGLVRRF